MSEAKGDCHHILGLDIMLDQNLKAWLLEINHQPSLEIEFSKQYMKDSKKAFKKYICEVDKTIKTQVVGDALKMTYETRSDDKETRNQKRREIDRFGCY